MLLTITTTHQPATDLGWLLHKHPDRVQEFKLGTYGKVHVFYPECTEKKCTASMLLDIDPIMLARGNNNGKSEGFTLQAYVNDRPYVASSFMSHAISSVYSSAMNGTCKDKPELLEQKLPLEVKISPLPCKGGIAALERLFEPLGYKIEAQGHVLDENFPAWGDSRYYSVTLSNTMALQDLLTQLFVLIPALDGEKHYYVSESEIEKLLKKGERWLPDHPAKEEITRRYLKYRKLGNMAMDILQEEETEAPDADEKEEKVEKSVVTVDNKPLNQQRVEAVRAQVEKCGAKSVLDLGCGEGRYLREFMEMRSLERVTGVDVSYRTVAMAKRRLNYERLPEYQQNRLSILQGSLIYKDERLKEHDAAVLVEVIEHIEPSKHVFLEKVIFGAAKPKTVIVTTPNSEFNKLFPTLPEGKFRHPDHRFEWTRAEFEAWANQVATTFGYKATFFPIGPVDIKLGAPTQMAVFNTIK